MDSERLWNSIYKTKAPEQLGWTQKVPTTSLDFVHGFDLPKTARIIDIGGGDSRLVDHLIEEGYRNITVLDLSIEALQRAQHRLGDKAKLAQWIVADVTMFQPTGEYDLWHDRAAFHFLTTEPQVTTYLSIARRAVHPGGYAVIGTFSNNGPSSCSGLPVRQYTEQALAGELDNGFQKIKCITEDHRTPFDTIQNFLFCSFKRA
jgi:ubiquinone/menaquinone biosynthesis C-methylase UbiE